MNVKYYLKNIKRFNSTQDIHSINSTDQYKFTCAGVYCAVAENTLNVTFDTCRLNCMDPNKICPSSNCYCYWKFAC